ncbi:MAG: hypothetical protein IKO83_10255 [Oscillospiraceae bacterium]|nr:hypothetical protein [Oscillospiraceae bacterium]
METTLERKSTTLRILKILFWIALAALSLTLLRRALVSVDTYRSIIESLDKKRSTIFGLITASTAISAAITLIPGDVGTPIAQQIAELSEYFIIVLGALYLEKYVLTILGFVSSVILVPGASLLSIAHEIKPGTGWKKRLAVSLLIVGIAGVLVVPASVAVSNSIDRTFHDSIQGSIDAVIEGSDEIEAEAEEQQTLWGALSNAAQSVTGGVSASVEKARAAVNHLIETVVILLVTDCLIPIVVVLFFVWLIKTVVKSLYARPTAPPERERGERFPD